MHGTFAFPAASPELSVKQVMSGLPGAKRSRRRPQMAYSCSYAYRLSATDRISHIEGRLLSTLGKHENDNAPYNPL